MRCSEEYYVLTASAGRQRGGARCKNACRTASCVAPSHSSVNGTLTVVNAWGRVVLLEVHISDLMVASL